MNYAEYLIVDPNVRFGKPIIKGTRISVSDVLRWMASGMDVENIIADFPELKEMQIRACLAYAADRERRYELSRCQQR